MAMIASLRRQTAAHIRAHYWSVISVFDVEPSFSYTIGLWMKRLPELIVVGIEPRLATGILNAAGKIMRDRGLAFEDCEVVDIGGRLPVKFIDAGNEKTRADWTIQAGQYWRAEDYAVRQMLVPDKEGRFPDNPNCAEPYRSVPWLGAARH